MRMNKSTQGNSLKSVQPNLSWIALEVSKHASGAAEGTRTPDPIITNDVLYQLSYSGHCERRYSTVIIAGKGLFSLNIHFIDRSVYGPVEGLLIG
jgi:hypothetical protein